MPDQEHQDFYEKAIDRIIDTFIDLLGRKTALMTARKAPLEINKDGDVTGFYGEGKQVLSILTDQYADVFGKTVARRKVRQAIEDMIDDETREHLPTKLRTIETDDNGFVARLLDRLWI